MHLPIFGDFTLLRSTVCESGNLEDLKSTHDHTLYLVCLSMLCAVGETSYGIGWSSSVPQIVFTIFYVFICILGVNSTLIQLCTQKPYFHNRKENNRRFPLEMTHLFLLTTFYTTSIDLLAYSTASVSHPIPLPAAVFSFTSVCK